MVPCPECNSSLDFDEDELDVGDEFTCEECGSNLRVNDTDPLDIELSEEDDDEDEESEDVDFDADEETDADADEEEEEGEEEEW